MLVCARPRLDPYHLLTDPASTGGASGDWGVDAPRSYIVTLSPRLWNQLPCENRVTVN